MGRIIKESEQQSEVTSASLAEEDFADDSDRIPADRVSRETGEGGDARPDEEPRGQVLRRTRARRVEQPVRIETEVEETGEVEGKASNSSPDASAEENEMDEAADSDDARTGSDRQSEWEAKLEEVREEARAEGYEEGREDGYDAGYEDGYEEAEEEVRAEFSERHDALLEDITHLDNLWAQYIDESEPMLVDLALRLAEVIVDAPLNDAVRQASEEALTEATAKLADTPPVTVTVHPVDYQRLHESGLVDHLTDKYEELRFESEPECTEGDWSVSSPDGVIRRLRYEVIESLRNELRLSQTDSGPSS